MTLLSPLSGLYYWQRGTRQEEVQASPIASADLSVSWSWTSYAIFEWPQPSTAEAHPSINARGCLGVCAGEDGDSR